MFKYLIFFALFTFSLCEENLDVQDRQPCEQFCLANGYDDGQEVSETGNDCKCRRYDYHCATEVIRVRAAYSKTPHELDKPNWWPYRHQDAVCKCNELCAQTLKETKNVTIANPRETCAEKCSFEKCENIWDQNCVAACASSCNGVKYDRLCKYQQTAPCWSNCMEKNVGTCLSDTMCSCRWQSQEPAAAIDIVVKRSAKKSGNKPDVEKNLRERLIQEGQWPNNLGNLQDFPAWPQWPLYPAQYPGRFLPQGWKKK